ncbi:AT-rich interactive domain-containing protein 5A [Chanos chanos]|uniref:AT-rich interactive domain-containing protein 5A n=1 Tax=Chanos chanos TaxID=29144 RepID=A0A6J2URM1_CHACN|nr:AT-rich interactive domain-containing protein 5A [Chanos chanos]
MNRSRFFGLSDLVDCLRRRERKDSSAVPPSADTRSHHSDESDTNAALLCMQHIAFIVNDCNTREMESSESTNGNEESSRSVQSETEERTFVTNLYRFMKDRGTPIERIPHLGFKQINLWKIYKAVETLGGYDSVTAQRLWKNVYDELGGSPGSTSAATCTRRHYERLVLPFERHLKGEEDKPLPPSKPRKQYKKSPEGKSNKTEAKRKRKLTDREGDRDSEKVGPDHHCEMGTCHLSAHWPASSDRSIPDHLDSHSDVVSVGDHSPIAACHMSHQAQGANPETCTRGTSVLLPPGPAEVISPLEKKKRLAQACLTVPTPPGGDDTAERPSVIHHSQPPTCTPHGRTRNSSEGSPLPLSSPSASVSRGSSPYSISSEDSVKTHSPSVAETEKRTPTHFSPGRPSVSSNVGVCKPQSQYPSIKDQTDFSRQHYKEFLQVSPSQGDCVSDKAQRNLPGWGADGRGGARASALKPPPISQYGSPAKPYWSPTASSFTKVLPKSADHWRPASTQPVYKLAHQPHSKRPMPEESLSHMKKAMYTLRFPDKKEKSKPVLAKPLPAPQPLLHPHPGLPYLPPPYDRTGRGDLSEPHLKALPIHPALIQAPLNLPQSQGHLAHRLPLGPIYPAAYESTLRAYPYSVPIWHPHATYSMANLQPFYPNTRL